MMRDPRPATLVGLMVATAAVALGGGTASACNRIDGCNWEEINQNREMMATGKMQEAMREGQSNIDAFRLHLQREREFREQHGASGVKRR